MIPCRPGRTPSRRWIWPRIEAWLQLVVLLVEFILRGILSSGRWSIRLKQVSDLIVVEFQEWNAEEHLSIHQLLNEEIVEDSWYQSHSFYIRLLHYLIISRISYWVWDLRLILFAFGGLPSDRSFFVFDNLIEHEFDLTFFDFTAYISLHSVCLPRRCWPVYNYIAILALYEFFAHFFSALFKYLGLCRFTREYIFELIVPVRAFKVRTRQYFKTSLSLVALGHDKNTGGIVFNLIVNHLVLFVLGKGPHSCRYLYEHRFIL